MTGPVRWWEHCGPSVVYRFYDDEDDLLYVGVTNSTTRRFAEHFGSRSTRSWQNVEIARHTIEPFDRREDAERAEAVAIFTEGPIHNSTQPNGWHKRLYSGAPIPDRTFRIRERVATRLGMDPGEWAYEMRQAEVRVPWSNLIDALAERTGRVAYGLMHWAEDYGPDPWCKPVEIGWRLPDWRSVPNRDQWYADELWRMD